MQRGSSSAVEHRLARARVASSNLVFRSTPSRIAKNTGRKGRSPFHGGSLRHEVSATVRKLAPTEVELDIEVSAPDFEAARERAFRKLVKQYRLPRFRPGRGPRPIFERHIGLEAIDHQAVEDVVPDAYSKALKEHNLDPVDRPHFDLERLDNGNSL